MEDLEDLNLIPTFPPWPGYSHTASHMRMQICEILIALHVHDYVNFDVPYILI